LEKVTSDICGLILLITYDKFKYIITFLDTKTRFLEIKLLRTKDEADTAFIEYKNKNENNINNKRIHIFATNNSTKYINDKFKNYLLNHNITHQLALVSRSSNGTVRLALRGSCIARFLN